MTELRINFEVFWRFSHLAAGTPLLQIDLRAQKMGSLTTDNLAQLDSGFAKLGL